MRNLASAVLWLGTAFVLPAHAAAHAFDRLAALEEVGARVSAAVLDLSNNALLADLNADTRRTPASLTKLPMAAAALDAWPADKTFRTRLLTTAPIEKGTLAGDLTLQGAGDPSLEGKSLWALAAQLKGAGVHAIQGGLVVNAAPFGLLECETSDRCKALERSDTAYNAPLAALGVDFGNWCLSVRPTTLASPAAVQGCGVKTLPVPVEGVIKTVGVGSRQTFWVERVTRADGDRIRVGGDIPLDRGQDVYRAMSDPAKGAGLLFREVLREIGIRIEGPVRVTAQELPSAARVLAEVEGLSMREQLGRMLRFSNNYIADVLTLNLAAAVNKEAPADLSTASSVLSSFVSRAQRTARVSTLKTPSQLFSGSGLTPENLISASELVGLLAHQYRDTRRFPAFYGGLVVPRDAPFQFLRTGTPAWLDRVALKTGTMEQPHSVCGIAGYLRKKDGGWMAFAVMVNGGPGMKRVPLFRAMAAARGDIEAILAAY